jgi:hypothetical protein
MTIFFTKPLLFAVLLMMGVEVVAQGPAYLLPNDKRYSAAKAHFVSIARTDLKDPDSAKFGSVIVCAWTADVKLALIQVNAKNSFGAYTGLKIGAVIDDGTTRGVIFANLNPSNPAEVSGQNALLSVLDACEPAMVAYKSGGFEN